MVARETTGRVKKQAANRVRREIFVLTPEEKRTLCFVLAAFLLGLAAARYRAAHPPSPPKTETTARVNPSLHPVRTRAK
jgi:hypothetical protein